ncbi:MAG TPA: beta-propeller fold lactonase family protein [Stellaceae bacterium]|nr:beta-propeller fold lactonase family protein [Stellaceae bacterium]
MKRYARLALLAAAALLGVSAAARAQLIISANDEKISWDANGKLVNGPPGKDTVSIIDIRERKHPRIVANLPLMNTVVGPPVNLAITPDQHLALVANSLDWVKDGDAWKGVPDNKLYVIDLTASPPALIATLELGKQPSGLAINRAGNLALVANRADNSVSVLSINGKEVKVVDTVSVSSGGPTNEQPSAVAITPDGKRALVAKFAGNKVALLTIDGQKVTYTKYDMATGLWPYNVLITPNGKLAIAGNNGGSGSSDGQIDTAAIIDMEADPPRVIDQVVVGDGPEGLAMSPTGAYAVEVILNGANLAHDKFFYHPHSYVSLLKIDGKKVRKVSEAEVGALAEGVVFSPDGKYLYVGNFMDADVTILQLQGDKLMKVGTLPLPGHPAAMRGSTP